MKRMERDIERKKRARTRRSERSIHINISIVESTPAIIVIVMRVMMIDIIKIVHKKRLVAATGNVMNQVTIVEDVILEDMIAEVQVLQDLGGRTHIVKVHDDTAVARHEITEVHDTVSALLDVEEAREDVLEALEDQSEIVKKVQDAGALPMIGHYHANEKQCHFIHYEQELRQG
jgi:hypothetical protein